MMSEHEKKIRAIEVGKAYKENYERYKEMKEEGYSRAAISEKLGLNEYIMKMFDRNKN